MSFNAGDSNLYRYVSNRPTVGTDPSGLWTMSGMLAEYQKRYGAEGKKLLVRALLAGAQIKGDKNGLWTDAWDYHKGTNTIIISERQGPWILFGADRERSDASAADKLHEALEANFGDSALGTIIADGVKAHGWQLNQIAKLADDPNFAKHVPEAVEIRKQMALAVPFARFAGKQIQNGLDEAAKTTAEVGLILLIPMSAGASGGRLVHMTTREAAAAINASKVLKTGYAGPASNAARSGWALTARTGLAPGGTYVAIQIPEAGEAAFSNARPIGLITGWQRLTGQQYAARGLLNLESGAFTRLGVNWNQVAIYALDVVIDGVTVTVIVVGTRHK